MYPATTLWHEVAGIHVDQSASVLRCLKLATSWRVRTGRGASSGPFPHPPRENRAYGFHHTTAHAGRASIGSSFAGFSRCIPPDCHPVSCPTAAASRLRCFPLYAALPRSLVGRHSHEYSHRSATSHTPG